MGSVPAKRDMNDTPVQQQEWYSPVWSQCFGKTRTLLERPHQAREQGWHGIRVRERLTTWRPIKLQCNPHTGDKFRANNQSTSSVNSQCFGPDDPQQQQEICHILDLFLDSYILGGLLTSVHLSPATSEQSTTSSATHRCKKGGNHEEGKGMSFTFLPHSNNTDGVLYHIVIGP